MTRHSDGPMAGGVDGVRDAHPQLTAEDVADALAYYLLHREDVDRHIADLSHESPLDEDDAQWHSVARRATMGGKRIA